jgi:hypothetical protein
MRQGRVVDHTMEQAIKANPTFFFLKNLYSYAA